MVHNLKQPDKRKLRHYLIKKGLKLKCLLCGTKKDIQMHHIKPIATYPELEFEPSNISFLCRCCHLLVHNGGSSEYNIDFKKRVKNVYNNLFLQKISKLKKETTNQDPENDIIFL
jgi:5-methylcytosine-specific restriction endonuclease McrA